MQTAFRDARLERGGYQAGYRAGENTRFSRDLHGANPLGGPADNHYSTEYRYHRANEVANDIDRNDMVVGQGIDTATTNIVQQGFGLDPLTGDAGANEIIKEKWRKWTEDKHSCDVQRRSDFRLQSWLALRSVIVSGDLVGLPLQSGALQTAESYRMRTPVGSLGRRVRLNGGVIHGVHLDPQRKRLGYWLTKDNIRIDRPVGFRDAKFYRAYDSQNNERVIHLYHPRRFTQTRGV